MDLLDFMERRLSDFEKRGDQEKARRLKQIIKEYKAMLDQEQQTLSSF